jgi:hypothetical protein
VLLGRRTKCPHERATAAKGSQRDSPLIRLARRVAVDGRSRLSFRTPPVRTRPTGKVRCVLGGAYRRARGNADTWLTEGPSATRLPVPLDRW